MKHLSAFVVSMSMFVAFLLIGSGSIVWAQQPLRVDVKAKELYLPGLPLVIQANVVNASAEIQNVPLPALNRANISASVKKEGATGNLVPTMNRGHFVPPEQLVSLKPGEKVSVLIDLSMDFLYDLPVGRYSCQVAYRGADGIIISKPIPIIIAEPTHKNAPLQEYLRREMTKFLAGKIYLVEQVGYFDKDIFRNVAGSGDHPYARISQYYLALTETEPQKKIEALEAYLKRPSADLPDLLTKKDIQIWLGRLHFESGNLVAAKEIFLGIPEPDTLVKEYLRKVEAASKPGP